MVPPTVNSDRRLSEVARHLIMPSGIETTAWPVVETELRRLSLPLDEWQRGLCEVILGKRTNGQYACGIGGALLSVPRQSGKTYTIGALVFALCLAYPGLLVLWTAHRTRTHNETFKTMDGMANRPRIAPFIENVRKTNGEQEITFANGSRIMFGARETGFGRGFAKVDIVVLDEAQILTESAMEDMVPATNAAPNGLVIMMGTPPRPKDPGEVFMSRRNDALSGDDEDVLYVEFSADKGADPNDRKQWAIANPSFPLRTSETAILRMRKLLGSADSFLREGMGIWDEEALAAAAVKMFRWESLTEEDPSEDWPLVSVGVDMDPSMTKVSICAAVARDDERHHIELLADAAFNDAGTSSLVEYLWGRCKKRVPVVIDAFSPARDLLEARLINRGLTVKILTTNDCVSAAALMNEAVDTLGSITHYDQEQLNDSVRGAVKSFLKNRPSSYKWNSRNLDDDLAPFNAATWALYGAIKFARRRRSSGESSKRRHAVVL